MAKDKAIYRLMLQDQHGRISLIEKNICGGAPNGTFRYDLEIATSSLDKQGFVLDNRVISEIQNAWSDRMYVASCETLAGGLIRFIHSKLARRGVRLVARVYNKTGYAETFWEKGNTLPTGPRIPTPAELRQERNQYARASRAAASC